jgi:hypothetical protein
MDPGTGHPVIFMALTGHNAPLASIAIPGASIECLLTQLISQEDEEGVSFVTIHRTSLVNIAASAISVTCS